MGSEYAPMVLHFRQVVFRNGDLEILLPTKELNNDGYLRHRTECAWLLRLRQAVLLQLSR